MWGSYIHSWICGGRNNESPTNCPQETTKSTTPTHQTKLWRKVQYDKVHPPPLPGKIRQKFHPGFHGQFTILLKRSWFYHANRTWINFHLKKNPIENNMKKVKKLVDYSTTHPEIVFTYGDSDMILAVHIKTSYISETNSRSTSGGNFFMSSESPDPPNTGSVFTISQIIKAVMSLAAEDKLGYLYINF